MKRTKINQVGDTIVEVLLVVTILAVTLSGAYAIANRSSKGVQANKERYQAQLIANSQAERIRSTIDTARNTYRAWNSTNKGCLDSRGESTSPIANNCQTNDGNTFTTTGLYSVSIECVNTCGNPNYNTYKIRVEWDSIIGSTATGKDNVELYYGA